jgi:hypothetical protein
MSWYHNESENPKKGCDCEMFSVINIFVMGGDHDKT